eukprot:5715643-Prymnesium_polylepis.1
MRAGGARGECAPGIVRGGLAIARRLKRHLLKLERLAQLGKALLRHGAILDILLVRPHVGHGEPRRPLSLHAAGGAEGSEGGFDGEPTATS